MPDITIDSTYLLIGGPALLAGLLLGAVIVWRFLPHAQVAPVPEAMD